LEFFMETVADILAVKGSLVHGVRRTATVFEAIESMTRYNVGALVVTDEDQLCGIITERDYLRRVAVVGRTSKTTAVDEVMSTRLVCVSPGTTLDRCMQLMTERRIRHLPVLVGDRLTGIVSIGDIVKALIHEQATQIQHLTDYIQGRA
jgi:CBS domain-containing protein